MRCHATVLQKGSDFRLCSIAHVHPADPKLHLRAKSSTIVKQRIKEQPHARAIKQRHGFSETFGVSRDFIKEVDVFFDYARNA
ncbi:hypothetical protein DPMN_160454 [Dreissena polymorpha]|uniref:Uncharacterized protein n=1 Tax=Dreissena polymorpha TaxID=45954 RepID=A0A9D4ER92_DREPO|nr:hypothetical protein DPMN_160454 [Dreissena polymorpha]